MKVSPVDQAVITQALVAAADEMGIRLIRSAHSPVVREAQDCSAAILDRTGRVVSQADLIPIQLGSVTHTFRACLQHHPLETLREGDFLINNDPYSGGQHLPDIFLFSPIFLDGLLVGITATVVHHIDLGGGERLKGLCRKFGAETVFAAMDEMLAYSERRIRAAIAAAPDGTWRGEAWLDDDGTGDDPVPRAGSAEAPGRRRRPTSFAAARKSRSGPSSSSRSAATTASSSAPVAEAATDRPASATPPSPSGTGWTASEATRDRARDELVLAAVFHRFSSRRRRNATVTG